MTIRINIRKAIAIIIAIVAVTFALWASDAIAAPYPFALGGTNNTSFATGTVPVSNGTQFVGVPSSTFQAALTFPLASTYGGTGTTTPLGTNAFSSVSYYPASNPSGYVNSSTGANYFAPSSTVSSQWTLSGSNLYPASTSYKVGIGTTTPAYTLDVVGAASNGNPILRVGDGTSSYGVFIGNGDANAQFGTITNTPLILLANNAIALTLSTSKNATFAGNITVSGSGNSTFAGNVGIGTTTPSYPLSVIGDASYSGTLRSFNGSTIQSAMYTDSSGTFHLNAWNNISLETGGTPHLYYNGGTGLTGIGIGTLTSPSAALEVYGSSTNPAFIVSTPSSSNALYVATSSNVGIGTSTPSQLLQVGTTMYVNNSNGRVGVGIASPATAVDVSGQVEATGGFNVPSYNSSLVGNTLTLYGGNGSFLKSDASGNLSFGYLVSSVATTTMTLLNTGYLGINNSSPSMQLEVSGSNGLPNNSGSTQVGALRLGVVGGANTLDVGVNNSGDGASWIQAEEKTLLSVHRNILLNPNGGNVAIGNTSPSSTLDVSGSVGMKSTVVSTSTTAGASEEYTFNGASAATTTLPTIGTSINREYEFKNIGTATDTIVTGTSTDYIYGLSTSTSYALGVGHALTIHNDSIYWEIISTY